MELKYQCSKCLDYKIENDFYRNKCYKRKLSYICKKCYENNFKLNDKRIICQCGSEILKSSFRKHKNMMKHITHTNEKILI